MEEILTIKNLGPIKNITLNLKKVNIFIGDQGTGKSTVAKTISLLKNFCTVKFVGINQLELIKDIDKQFKKSIKFFELESFFNLQTEIYYFNQSINTTISYKHNIATAENLSPSLFDGFNLTYIVAERIFVSVLGDALFAINETGAKLPNLFNRFGNKFATAKKTEPNNKYASILGVNFIHQDGNDYIQEANNTLILLKEGSSGIQGTIPLLVVFDQATPSIEPEDLVKNNAHNLLVIEEPELNLFPASQKKLVDYIISNNLGYNTFKNQLVITTHSPYILTALNNLMYAHKVGQINSVETNKLVAEKYWLNPKEVSAYYLNKDGSLDDIFDYEDDQIKAEAIDEISNIINNQYAQLGELKYGIFN